jgi:hypothetical protein
VHSDLLTPASNTFSEIGGIGSVTVTTGASCPWSASPDYRWLTLLPGASNSGNGIVFYAVDRNTNLTARTGTLTVAGQPFTVTQSGTPPDINGDGLPDTWQSLYFGSPGSTNAAPGADPDGDGAVTLLEYLAGTFPNDSNSVIRIKALAASTNLPLRVDLTTGTNRLYEVQTTEDLVGGYWLGLGAAVQGNGGLLSVEDPAVSNLLQRFYRVRLYP